MQHEEIHIGRLVKSVFEDSGMTVAELARQLFCERTNVYAIFHRKSIDVEMLARLSKILNHNFLDDAMRLYGLTATLSPTLNLQVPLTDCTPDQLSRLSALLDAWKKML